MNITGRCQCGDITFRVTAEPIMSGHCHCLDCQKSSGTGHTAMIAFPENAVHVAGRTATYQSPADSGGICTRHFCPRCGSRLFGCSTGMPGMFTVSATALDDPTIFKPMMSVYMKRRQPWDTVAPDVPSYEALPPLPA